MSEHKEFTFNIQVTIQPISKDSHDVRMACYGEITEDQRALADEVMHRFRACLNADPDDHPPRPVH